MKVNVKLRITHTIEREIDLDDDVIIKLVKEDSTYAGSIDLDEVDEIEVESVEEA